MQLQPSLEKLQKLLLGSGHGASQLVVAVTSSVSDDDSDLLEDFGFALLLEFSDAIWVSPD